MENKEEKKQEEQKPQQEKTKMRQIIIETDGNQANFVKTEVAGSLELKAILIGLANNIK